MFCAHAMSGPAWAEHQAGGRALPGREALVTRAQGLLADGGELPKVLFGDRSGPRNVLAGINERFGGPKCCEVCVWTHGKRRAKLRCILTLNSEALIT